MNAIDLNLKGKQMADISGHKTRDSGIELLRIVAMFLVLVSHYINGSLGGGFCYVQTGSVNELILYLLECISICAVNIFVLITGYYLSGKKEINVRKPLDLFVRCLVFLAVYSVVISIVQKEVISFDSINNGILPNYWFIIIYSVIYILSPYINKAIAACSDKQLGILVLLMFVFFSLIPILLNSISFYSYRMFSWANPVGGGRDNAAQVINFAGLYTAGAFLRRIDEKVSDLKIYKPVLGLIVVIIIDLAWVLFDKTVYKEVLVQFALHNPLIIAEAVLLFVIFRKLNIRNNKVINRVSGAAFTVYITHLFFIRLFSIEDHVRSSPLIMLGHIILFCMLLYLAGMVINELYGLVNRPFYNLLKRKTDRV
ncbi:MAG: acyltransferase family protein [Clostridiales bacterium]|nr:acyltransferase family protein [Clostridiales bacterium]